MPCSPQENNMFQCEDIAWFCGAGGEGAGLCSTTSLLLKRLPPTHLQTLPRMSNLLHVHGSTSVTCALHCCILSTGCAFTSREHPLPIFRSTHTQHIGYRVYTALPRTSSKPDGRIWKRERSQYIQLFVELIADTLLVLRRSITGCLVRRAVSLASDTGSKRGRSVGSSAILATLPGSSSSKRLHLLQARSPHHAPLSPLGRKVGSPTRLLLLLLLQWRCIATR